MHFSDIVLQPKLWRQVQFQSHKFSQLYNRVFIRAVTRLECGFRCNDGRCQPSENRCNGIVDCPDAIDESNCGVCKRTEFTCTSDSACIDYLKRCDGNNDCKDGSDEQLCQG